MQILVYIKKFPKRLVPREMLFNVHPTALLHRRVLQDAGQLLGKVYRITGSGQGADSGVEEIRGTALIDRHYGNT